MRRRLEPSVVRWLTLAAGRRRRALGRERPAHLARGPASGPAPVGPVGARPGADPRLRHGPGTGRLPLARPAEARSRTERRHLRPRPAGRPRGRRAPPGQRRALAAGRPPRRLPRPRLRPRRDAPRCAPRPGRHRIAGRFAWSRLPESLSVPAEIGLVDLRLDGQAVPRPRRDEAGLLWLRAGTEAVGEGESLRLQVFRRIRDGIPLFVETRLELEVAGRAREITLPGALLPGTVPVAVSGDLPARVEKDALRVQVRGGRYSVSVEARVEGRPKAIGLPKEPAEGPLAAARGVGLRRRRDAAAGRALRPHAHRPLAHRAARGVARAAGVPRRARREPRPQGGAAGRGRAAARRAHPRARALARPRRAAARASATASAARSARRRRLDLLPPGHARPHRRRRPGPARHRPPRDEGGRRRAARARPCSSRPTRASPSAARSPPSAGRPASSSSRPPSTSRPAGASSARRGVDRLPGTWTSRWTLLGFFFVLIVTLAVHRLFGLRPALLALAALVLTHGEPGAPSAVWLSLVAAIALQRVAPAGWIPRLARALVPRERRRARRRWSCPSRATR